MRPKSSAWCHTVEVIVHDEDEEDVEIGAKVLIKCKYCDAVLPKNATRVASHIAGSGAPGSRPCASAPSAAIRACAMRRPGSSLQEALSTGAPPSSKHDPEPLSAKIPDIYDGKSHAAQEAHRSLAQWAFKHGIAFNDKNEMRDLAQVISRAGSHFSFPNAYALSNKLLDDEYENAMRSSVIPAIRTAVANERGLTLMCDFGTTSDRRSELAVCLANTESVVFWDVHDTKGQRKGIEYVVTYLRSVIASIDALPGCKGHASLTRTSQADVEMVRKI